MTVSEDPGRPRTVDAASPVEVVSERTPRSTVFANPDGTRTLRVFDGVAFVRARDGRLVELDTALRKGPDGRLIPGAAANVSMGPHSTDAAVGGIGFGPGTWVGFGVRDAVGKPVTVDGATATYAGVRPGADLVLTATEWGLKEDIVLWSKDAPTSWTFPLSLRGLTPALDTAAGTVVFSDGTGQVRGFVPPGFMVDSKVDPLRGTGARSNNVTYSLERAGDGWALRVDLDAAWLRDPARVFPVIADPSFRDDAESDDTFVSSRENANRNNSSESNLPVGTYNGGAEKSASYVHFDQLKSTLDNRYILGASANFWNYWSSSCQARPVTVYKVTQPWAGSTTKTWAGPAYDAASPLSTRTFAHGHTNCPGGAWESFALSADRVMGWVHNTESFYGLTLRASLTDSLSWKRFSSANFSVSTARPFLDVNFSDQGARYALPSPVFDPPVTATAAGRITIRVTNWGMTTWTPTNGYRLTFKVLNGSGGVVQNGPLINLPSTVGPHQAVDVPVDVAAIGTAGNFTLRMDMVDPAGGSFNASYGVPFGSVPFTIANGPPTIRGNYPANNGLADSLTPSLWADYYDPDNTPAARRYTFRICNGTPAAPVGCVSSGEIRRGTWQVPWGTLRWGKTAFWYVTVSDTQLSSPEIGPIYFTPIVPQPAISSHLGNATGGGEVPGLNPLVGNYSTTATDASVSVAGPALAVTRTSNSQNSRVGAFGVGWSSPLDQRLVEEYRSNEPDDVLITLDSGRQIRFGVNPDQTYVAPPGINMTLTKDLSALTWTLRDADGVQRMYDNQGRLYRIVDADGRAQDYRHVGTQVAAIVDAASGRELRFTWTGSTVSQVTAYSPQTGAINPWTYTYTGNQLTQVCSPLSAASCTTYEYTTRSLYRAAVQEDEPAAYWGLGETEGSVARNIVATSPGELDGNYSGVGLGGPSAIPGLPDGSVTFSAGSAAAVALPTNLINAHGVFTLEMWFKAAPGQSGSLFVLQNGTMTNSTFHRHNLYVDTNGTLRFWHYSASIHPDGGIAENHVKPGVTDGQWHHTVLSYDNTGGADIYVDGEDLGAGLGPIHHGTSQNAYLGNSRRVNPDPRLEPFTGQLDEAVFYRHMLTESQVDAHWAARNAVGTLTKITEPGGSVAAQIGYDATTGRVTSLTDRHGTAWSLAAPSAEAGNRVVVLSPATGEPITYRYDAARGGRLVSRTDTFGQKTWEYNAAGFVSKITDENGNATAFDTDARGNVLARTTCRSVGNCATEYSGYFLNTANPLDPRNDVRIWQADGRSASASDTTYRTTYDLDATGRVTRATYPKPAGQSTAPTETFTYSVGTEPPEGGGLTHYGITTQSRTFLRADQTVLPLIGDDEFQQIALPFPIRFYGETYANAWVSTNGFVSFAPLTNSHLGDWPIPSPENPNASAYAFWGDLVLDASASVRTAVTGAAPNRTFIVEWRNAFLFYEPLQRIDFEVVFAEGGEVSFNYAGIDADPAEQGASATTGVEDPTGDRAAQYSSGQPLLRSGTAVVFTPSTVPIPAGLLLATIGTDATVVRHFYNGAGDRVRTLDAANLTTTQTYDGLGRTTSTTTASTTENFGTTTYTYNGASLPATRTGPGVLNPVTGVTHTPVTTYGYDAVGRLTTQTVSDSTGGDPTRTWTFGYDPGGRLASSTTPDGVTTTQEWNNRGEMLKVTRPGDVVLEHIYDEAHRLIETAATGAGVDPIDPAATRLVLESRAYDPAGRLASTVDAMGRETGYTYYNDNRLASTSRVRRNATGDIVSITVLSTVDYDKAGHVTQSTGLGGVATTASYDPAGYLTSTVLDPGGLARTTAYVRNASGAVTRESRTGAASPGRTERTDYLYDSVGRLQSSTVDNTGGVPASLVTTFAWDARGLLTRLTEPTGAATSFSYDKVGHPLSHTGPARTTWVAGVHTDNVTPVTTAGRNTFGDLTDIRDPNGAITRTSVDAMGRPTQLQMPSYTPPGGASVQPTITTQYDSRGLPTSVTDQLGRLTTSTYDKYGRALITTEPDPDGAGPKGAPVWTFAYDRSGALLNATDPTGAQRQATYDDLGRAITTTVTDRTGGPIVYYTTRLGYDGFGNLATVTSPLDHATTLAYNRASEITGVTNPVGPSAQVLYDLAGRVVRQTIGGARAATSVYDLAGRPTSQSQHTVAGGVLSAPLATERQEYDAASRVTKVTSPEGRITSYGYDPAGQQTSVSQLVDPAQPTSAVTVTLGYDSLGRPTRMVDGRGNATDYTYNSLGWPESVIEPATPAHPAAADRTWTTVYDAAGQAVQERLPGGVTRSRTFDGLGRLMTETGAGGGTTTAARQLDYDPTGRLTKASGPAGDTTFAWNDRGLLAATTSPSGNATFAYDANGRITSRTDVTGTATFTYDAAGRPATTVDPLTGRTITYNYAPTGENSGFSMGSGAPSRAMTYDDLGRLATDTWRKPDGTTEASTTYGYDLDGLPTAKTTTGVAGAGPNSYGYDGLGRLRSWTGPSGQQATYGFDAASNRTTVTTPAGTRTTTYDARNRQTSATGGGQPDQSWVWAPRGTLASTTAGGQTASYTFDAFERLTRAQSPGYTVDYAYDGLDRLARRNGIDSVYADLTNNPVRSASPASEQALVFRAPDGTPISAKTGPAAARSLLTNQHGDVVAAADPGTGAVTASASYDPHGNATASSGGLPLGFQGGWVDPATGQVNAHARWYSPASGTFTSRDTWTLPPDPVARANRYQYANGAPTVYTDTSGHDPGGGSGPYECHWVDDEVLVCQDIEPGPDPGGGGGRSGEPQQKKEKKKKCDTRCRIPWLLQVNPRKPLGSEPNQRPQNEDLTGGTPILIEPGPIEPVLTSCDKDCTPSPNPGPPPGGPVPPVSPGTPNPQPGKSPAPGAHLPTDFFCNFMGMYSGSCFCILNIGDCRDRLIDAARAACYAQAGIGGPMAGCICIYEPRACWNVFLGVLEAIGRWIAANAGPFIALLAAIITAILCFVLEAWCLAITAGIAALAALATCWLDNRQSGFWDMLLKCAFAVLVAAFIGGLIGGALAPKWIEPLKKVWDWWRRGGGKPPLPGGPAPPIPGDSLLALR